MNRIHITASHKHRKHSSVMLRVAHNYASNLSSIPGQVSKFLPPANKVCEGYVFTGVCLSTGGEYLGKYTSRQVHPLGKVYPRAGTPPGRYLPGAGTPPGHSACWDMVNKRAVRIPLECILVFC